MVDEGVRGRVVEVQRDRHRGARRQLPHDRGEREDAPRFDDLRPELQDDGGALFLRRFEGRLYLIERVGLEAADRIAAGPSLLEHIERIDKRHSSLLRVCKVTASRWPCWGGACPALKNNRQSDLLYLSHGTGQTIPLLQKSVQEPARAAGVEQAHYR